MLRHKGLIALLAVLAVSINGILIAGSSSSVHAWRDTTSAVLSFGGSSIDIGRGLAEMSDGGFVSVGFTTSDPISIDGITISSASGTRSANNNRDMFVVRHDLNGMAVWAKAFGGPGNDYLYSVATDQEDNIYVAGILVMSGNFPSGAVGGTTTHPFVAKLNSAGDVLWHNALPATTTEFGEAISVVVHPTGGIVLVGGIDGGASFGGRLGTDTTGDGFVARYSDTGTLTWAAKIYGASLQEVNDVAVGANGDIHVVGYVVREVVLQDGLGTVSTSQSFPRDTAFHIVLSASGARKSETYFEASDEARGFSVTTQSDGSALIGLAVEGSITIGSRTVISSETNTASVLIKRNQDGNVIWVQEFNHAQFSSEPRDVAVATDGAIWMTGTFIRSNNQEQIFVARYLEDGTASFSSPLIFGDPNKRSIGQAFLAVSSGQMLLTGRFGGGVVNPQDSNDQIDVSGVSDVIIMKLTPNGTLASATTSVASVNETPTPASTSTPAAPTVAPTVLRYRAANKRVTLRWSAVEGAASYVVTTTGGVLRCETTTTSCTVRGLRNGKAYTYLLYSVNADGVRSETATRVSVRPGFVVRRTSLKQKRSLQLSSIVTTPSKGKQSWQVTSGGCRISNGRLVAPARRGSCKLRLTTVKRGAYPAMSTTVRITVNR